jgi:hypothetical protein
MFEKINELIFLIAGVLLVLFNKRVSKSLIEDRFRYLNDRIKSILLKNREQIEPIRNFFLRILVIIVDLAFAAFG